MSVSLQITPESGLLSVFATGKFSLETAKSTFLEIMEASALHKCEKVLLDGRSLTGNPERMERFYYGEFAAETVMNSIAQGLPAARQFAYILREPVLDPRRFGETVAMNRGMNAKTFESRRDALQWLGIAQNNNPVPRETGGVAVRNDLAGSVDSKTQAALNASTGGAVRRPFRSGTSV